MSGRVHSWKANPIAAATAAFVLSAAFFAATMVAVPLRGETVLVVLWCLLLAGVVGVAAWWLGPLFAVPLALAAAVAIDSFYIAPYRPFDSKDWINYPVTAMYLAIGVFVGAVLEATQRRAASSETARGNLAEEQAALRRVATLVARAAPPEEVFATVAEEVGQLLDAEGAVIHRFDPDGAGTVVGIWGNAFEIGSRFKLDGTNVASLVHRTERSVRLDHPERGSGAVALGARKLGMRSAIGSPIVVSRRIWGAIAVASSRSEPMPADTEARIAQFTELVATTISNIQARSDLAASRARIVVAGDEARRRIERDLHDGVQQRLVSLALRLRRTERRLPREDVEVKAALSETVQELNAATEEVRAMAQGIHPAILTQGGLAPALRNLARGCAIPVEVVVESEERLPEPVEVAAYYVAAEALTNATKHSAASRAWVAVERHDGVVRLRIGDDGVGGADPSSGSGLTGLRDRVEALGGALAVSSPRGEGTALDVVLPVAAQSGHPEASG